MCKGLAVITEKIDNEWIVYAKEKESSHDKLLHTLRDDLRYGIAPHLKFEVIFPNQIKDDIEQDCKYPKEWIQMQFGKKIACKDAFKAVSEYIYLHPELLNFDINMLSDANLHNANLHNANLHHANLNNADLHYTNLYYVNLSNANLYHANLSNADLRNANLSDVDLRNADLRYANLSNADLRNANLSDTDLRGANLRDANLSGANLYYVNLSGANLRDTNLINTIGYEPCQK